MCMENDVGRLVLFHDMLCFWLAVTKICFARAQQQKREIEGKKYIINICIIFVLSKFSSSQKLNTFCSMVAVVSRSRKK